MRKVLAMVMAAVMVMSVVAPAVQAAAGKSSGAAGFFTGCCFGLRTGADYNDQGTGSRDFLPWFLVGICLGPRTAQDYRDGKDFHWREIGRAIPYVGIIFYIWDGIDIAGGKGRSDLQQVYPGNYY